MAYRYMGKGTTNSDGVATLTENSSGQTVEHSYTGTGAGLIDVVASMDNPIVDGSIVSETYELLDASFYDEAIDGHKNTYWFCNNWDNISVGTTGTTIEEFTSTAINYSPSTVANSSTWNDRRLFNIGFVVEFDILEYAPNVRIVVNNATESKTINELINAQSHFKLEVKIGEYTVTRDNGTPVTNSHNIDEDVRVILMTNNDGYLGKLTFNNFKIYPI